MEHTTSFDLSRAIEGWREGLRESPEFRAEDLAELEAHLRDAVAVWQGRGLTEEEAFLLAARRLGNPASLRPEFAKVNHGQVWLDRLLWMLIGIQVLGLLSTLSAVLADTAVCGGLAGIGYDFAHATGVWSRSLLPVALLSFAHLLVLGGAVGGLWWWVRRKESGLRSAAAGLVRRPLLAGIAICLVLLVAGLVLNSAAPLLYRNYGPNALASIALSTTLARGIVYVAETVILAGLTVLLLRRRLRTS